MISPVLYTQLQQYFASWIDHGDFSFVTRLSFENNWSLNFTRRTIQEYIKFIYLVKVSKTHLTPSDEVDQVWHLHLQYSKKYDEMSKILEFKMNHDPTEGGNAERVKFDHWYALTKEWYQKEFQKSPPSDIWPDSYTRFNISPLATRVNTHNQVVISKALFKFLIITTIVLTLLALRSFYV